jgi:alginate O-acetyltransferase complex protein AlgI
MLVIWLISLIQKYNISYLNMVFTSFNFLIFFPLLSILYWIVPAKYRWLFLLLASYFFYINIKPVYAFLVAGVTISTYVFTRLIDETNIESRKQTFMIINICLILLPLFFFKYFSVINNEIISLLNYSHLRWPLPEIKLLLPIGISFYTFMAIGYTIDVYNEDIEAERNIGFVALFLSFFPLILSGPIERAKNMLPQFKAIKFFDYDMVVQGLKLMLWGYFMKLVVADRVGIYVDAIYDNIPFHNGTSLLFASCLFPFQVYADLGGYTLISIGTAKILGINVMHNFNRPFFATTMSEFWHRWHISLISWLTDYIYTPLSFVLRKYKIWGIVMALMITFLISGIWHGAALKFVMWGLIQGVFLSVEALTYKKRALFEKKHQLTNKSWYIFLEIILTFILFTSSQIFGRSANINEAFTIYHRIFTIRGPLFIGESQIFLFSILGIFLLLLKDFADEFIPNRFLFFESKHNLIRIMAYSSIIIIILLIGVFDKGQFIYFKF